MRRLFTAMICVALLAACTKLDLAGSNTAPAPTPTSGPTPGVCGTPGNDPNTVLVAMGNLIGPNSIPPYGTINGYSVVQNGQFATQAMLINQWLTPTGVGPITPHNILQFANVDSSAAHSAVGFIGSSFPPPSFVFPSPAASPTGSAVSAKALWSTGRIAASLTSQT